LKGDALYRIRETNQLNATSYSPVLRLRPAVNGFIRIYPNPLKDKLFISRNGGGETATIILTDIQGRQVRSIQMAGSTQTIDMRGLPAGVYVVRIGNGAATKVIKE
jgi:hypothetical protein